MRQKRAKSYRKQLSYLQLNFKFREPYQILIDAQMILEAIRTKLDLLKALERTVQGKVKPMVTQCTIEALYKEGNQDAIELAKSFERRKCGHIPKAVTAATKKESNKEQEKKESKEVESETDEESEKEDENDSENEEEKSDAEEKKKKKKDNNKDTKKDSKSKGKKKNQKSGNDDDEEDHNGTKTPSACMWTVVAVDKTTNKHRYVVASQDFRLRSRLRTIPAVPLVYLNRSVMVLEPMSEATLKARNDIETAKLMRGLNPEAQAQLLGKRKAEGDPSDPNSSGSAAAPVYKKKKAKGPHPLSNLKKKKKPSNKQVPEKETNEEEAGEKKKRRRKHHKKVNGESEGSSAPATVEA